VGAARAAGGAPPPPPPPPPPHPPSQTEPATEVFCPTETGYSDLWLAEQRSLTGSRQLLSVPTLRPDT
jgi:hypothetical protein